MSFIVCVSGNNKSNTKKNTYNSFHSKDYKISTTLYHESSPGNSIYQHKEQYFIQWKCQPEIEVEDISANIYLWFSKWYSFTVTTG